MGGDVVTILEGRLGAEDLFVESSGLIDLAPTAPHKLERVLEVQAS
jgi:hypothetical protein